MNRFENNKFFKPTKPTIKSFVDKSVKIHGDINFVDTLEIQGHVFGNIHSDLNNISFLIIGKDCKILGNVISSHVIVLGEVTGNIFAKHIQIEESAIICGSVEYSSIEVHSGAKIDGLITFDSILSNSKKLPNTQNLINLKIKTIDSKLYDNPSPMPA